MLVPKNIKELLKNPIFKGIDINTLEKAINKKLDVDDCKRPSIVPDDTDGCVHPMPDDDRKKMVDDLLDKNDEKLPDGMGRMDIDGDAEFILDGDGNMLGEVTTDDTSTLERSSKYLNKNFSPDKGDTECAKECIDNISALVDRMKEKIVKDTDEFQKLDSHISDYYASSATLHNAFYALLTFYKYKNDTTKITRLKEIIEEATYVDTTNSKVATYFVSRMKRVMKKYISDIGSFNYQYSIFSRDLPVTIIELGISAAVRAAADIKLTKSIEDISNQIILDDNQVEYSINSQKIEEGVVNTIMDAYGSEPTEDEAKDPEYVKKKQTQLYDLLVSEGSKITSIFSKLKDNAKKIGYNFHTSNEEEYADLLNDAVNLFIEKHNYMISLLESTDIDNITKKAKDDTAQLFCCGQQLVVPDEPEADYDKDSDNRTYSGSNTESDITSSEYWREFTKYLNVNALIPIYWKIGIILPTPGGPLRIPLPIIFVHLITIKIFSVIIVIWLTINGLVIVPVVYTIQFLPIADAASVWLILFRGANKKVKDKTGVEILTMPIIGGINVNPELSKVLPFKQDDLPTLERMGLTNPLYLVYLNQMLQKATPSMGLP